MITGRGQASLLVLVAVLAVAVTAWAGTRDSYADSAPRVHPAISAFLQEHPGEKIPVIIRARNTSGEVMQDIESQGATDVAQLSLINGVAATLTAAQLNQVSRDPAVDFVSLDAVMISSGRDDGVADPSKLASMYPFSADAVPAWQAGVTGGGVTVAVIDSGFAGGKDFRNRVAGMFEFSSVTNNVSDQNGHGTYVSGLIAGKGDKYVGMAPSAQILSLKVGGRDGSALASDVINALQWTVDHKDQYGIRVINISLSSSIPDSYRQDPLDAAVEEAWFHGIVVVAAAGNYGTEAFSADHAPANDPYVIAVGAFDDNGTASATDDHLASWSSRGVTVDGYAKPEVVAPGVNIVSTLAQGSYLARTHRAAVVDSHYIRLSGTSAASAIVSGAVALMLDEERNLTPDQVKLRLMDAGTAMGGSRAPRIDAAAASFSQITGAANQDAVPCELIDASTGNIAYGSVLWNSVLWNSVLWNSVLWRS